MFWTYCWTFLPRVSKRKDRGGGERGVSGMHILLFLFFKPKVLSSTILSALFSIAFCWAFCWAFLDGGILNYLRRRSKRFQTLKSMNLSTFYCSWKRKMFGSRDSYSRGETTTSFSWVCFLLEIFIGLSPFYGEREGPTDTWYFEKYSKKNLNCAFLRKKNIERVGFLASFDC